MKKKVNITSEYITLGQFLKIADIISSGGEQKVYLTSHKVIVNDVDENRRGKKLRDGDVVEIDSQQYQICMLNK